MGEGRSCRIFDNTTRDAYGLSGTIFTDEMHVTGYVSDKLIWGAVP